MNETLQRSWWLPGLRGANARVSGVLDIVVALRVRKYMKGALLPALAVQVRTWSRLNAGRSSGPAGAV